MRDVVEYVEGTDGTVGGDRWDNVLIVEEGDDLPTVAQHERFADDLEAMVERVAWELSDEWGNDQSSRVKAARSIILGDKP